MAREDECKESCGALQDAFSGYKGLAAQQASIKQPLLERVLLSNARTLNNNERKLERSKEGRSRAPCRSRHDCTHMRCLLAVRACTARFGPLASADNARESDVAESSCSSSYTSADSYDGADLSEALTAPGGEGPDEEPTSSAEQIRPTELVSVLLAAASGSATPAGACRLQRAMKHERPFWIEIGLVNIDAAEIKFRTMEPRPLEGSMWSTGREAGSGEHGVFCVDMSRPALKELGREGPALGPLSPPTRLSATELTRRPLVPASACSSSFIYPLILTGSGQQVGAASQVVVAQGTARDRGVTTNACSGDATRLIQSGGFVFWDEKGAVVAIAALAPSEGMLLHGPILARNAISDYATLRQQLLDSHRLERATLASLTSLGLYPILRQHLLYCGLADDFDDDALLLLFDFCWLTPDEVRVDNSSSLVGAFLFLCAEAGRDCLFELTDAVNAVDAVNADAANDASVDTAAATSIDNAAVEAATATAIDSPFVREGELLARGTTSQYTWGDAGRSACTCIALVGALDLLRRRERYGSSANLCMGLAADAPFAQANRDLVDRLVSKGVDLAMERMKAGAVAEHCAIDELLQSLPLEHELLSGLEQLTLGFGVITPRAADTADAFRSAFSDAPGAAFVITKVPETILVVTGESPSAPCFLLDTPRHTSSASAPWTLYVGSLPCDSHRFVSAPTFSLRAYKRAC